MILFDVDTIKTVLFDLDGTLRHSVPNGHIIFWDFAEKLGAPNGPESRKKALLWAHEYWSDSQDLLIDVQTYGQENADFWVNYSRRHLLALGTDEENAEDWAPQINNHMRSRYKPEDVIPEDVPETLGKLKAAGYTLGLVTNRSDPVDEYLDKVELKSFFDFYFAAGEIGVWKPKPEIFYYALGLAGAKPHEALYVGDNYFADIIGARNANIEPILMDPDGLWNGDAGCTSIREIGELQGMLLAETV